MSATIKIRKSAQTVEITDVNLEGTVAELKAKIAVATGADPASQRLVFGGSVLDDTHTLAQHGVVSGATLHMVVRGNAPAAAPAPAPTATSTPTTAPTAATTQPPLDASTSPLMAMLQQLFTTTEGQMLIASARADPSILREIAHQQPALAGAIAEVISNPELMAQLHPPRTRENPFISREIFEVAMRCVRGDPVPAPYNSELAMQLAQSLPSGQADEDSGEDEMEVDPSHEGHGSFQQHHQQQHAAHEYISREQVANAIAVAQGRAPPPTTTAAPMAPMTRPVVRPTQTQTAAPAANPTETVRQRYGPQLSQLLAMGFPEADCVRALQSASGDLNTALAILLG